MAKIQQSNPHTGAFLKTKASTDAYRDGHDRIFGNKAPADPDAVPCFVADCNKSAYRRGMCFDCWQDAEANHADDVADQRREERVFGADK